MDSNGSRRARSCDEGGRRSERDLLIAPRGTVRCRSGLRAQIGVAILPWMDRADRKRPTRRPNTQRIIRRRGRAPCDPGVAYRHGDARQIGLEKHHGQHHDRPGIDGRRGQLISTEGSDDATVGIDEHGGQRSRVVGSYWTIQCGYESGEYCRVQLLTLTPRKRYKVSFGAETVTSSRWGSSDTGAASVTEAFSQKNVHGPGERRPGARPLATLENDPFRDAGPAGGSSSRKPYMPCRQRRP